MGRLHFVWLVAIGLSCRGLNKVSMVLAILALFMGTVRVPAHSRQRSSLINSTPIGRDESG